MDKLKMEHNFSISNYIDEIAERFPNCVTEVRSKNDRVEIKIDFDKLKMMLGDIIQTDDESYEFSWVGKRNAIMEANSSTRKILRPCIGKSESWNKTENIYIEGDNLETLKILQESYLGQVKFIYIDPPYNTGNDFIYRDDFKVSKETYDEECGAIDENQNRTFRNTDSNGRFHSDWCSMIYSRLLLARNMLSDDGVIFVSIDDNELANLIKICDEVFGKSNFIANMVWQSTAGSNTGSEVVTVTENILIYTKRRNSFAFNGMLASDKSYIFSDEYEDERGKYALDKLDRRRVGSHYSPALNYAIEMPDGSMRYPGGGSEAEDGWNYLWSKSKVKWGIERGFIEYKQTNGKWNVYNKRYAKIDNEGNPIERTVPFRNIISSDQYNTAQGTAELRSIFGFRPFDFPKPSELIKKLMLTAIRTDKEALVMDFFSGSASTAQAVMQLNLEDNGHRKYIMVQLPETIEESNEAWKAGYKTICEIGEERIRKVGNEISNKNKKIDVGFRVFFLDDSNMKDVYYAPADLGQQNLDSMISNIKEDRTDLDLLFGCVLDWGMPLSMPYFSEKISGFSVHTYGVSSEESKSICSSIENNEQLVDKIPLIACFDENISEDVIKTIAKRHPLRAVFRDSSFANSPAKINVEEIFKLLSQDTSVKVI